MLFMRKTTALPSAAEALPGRATPIPTATTHFVNGRKLQPPYPAGLEQAVFGLGCFWGAERKFWELGDGIHATAVGYAGGHTPNPTYEEVCSGSPVTPKGMVVFDPRSTIDAPEDVWENHTRRGHGRHESAPISLAIYTSAMRSAKPPTRRSKVSKAAGGEGAQRHHHRIAPSEIYLQDIITYPPRTQGLLRIGRHGVSCPIASVDA